MNIFYLHKNPYFAAALVTDAHVVKMPLESMQMLSTVVRKTVGVFESFEDELGGLHEVNVLPGEKIDFMDVVKVHFTDKPSKRFKLYPGGNLPRGTIDAEFLSKKPFYTPETQRALAISHPGHPSTVWAGESIQHFNWLKQHMLGLQAFWKIRYGHPVERQHKSVSLLHRMPEPDIPDLGFTPPPLAMPDEYKVDCPVRSYWNYYTAEKI